MSGGSRGFQTIWGISGCFLTPPGHGDPARGKISTLRFPACLESMGRKELIGVKAGHGKAESGQLSPTLRSFWGLPHMLLGLLHMPTLERVSLLGSSRLMQT